MMAANAKDTGLAWVFGGSSAKLLDFVRVNCFWDYSLRDMSRETGLSWRTVQKVVPRLLKLGILKFTRSEGRAKLYMFNKDSHLAKQLQTIGVVSDIAALPAHKGKFNGKPDCKARHGEES